MNGARDVLDTLLPEADEELAHRARRVTTLLRLLRAEAHSRAPASVGLSLERARAERERERRAEAARAVADLAIHHLDAIQCSVAGQDERRRGVARAG